MARSIVGSIAGRKVVALAGTPEALSTDTRDILAVTICAETDNSGIVVVGDSAVIASQPTRTGVHLNAGDVYTKTVNQLTRVYLDCVSSGDGVTFDADLVG